jgi:hypothetical protein
LQGFKKGEIMNRLKQFITITSLTLAVMGPVLVLGVQPVLAVDPGGSVSDGIKAAGGDKTDPKYKGLPALLKIIINILLFVIGAVSVIMIILGGIRYTLSNGDASQITSAKNTILYAVIGLIVALLAYAIVNFVVDQFAK